MRLVAPLNSNSTLVNVIPVSSGPTSVNPVLPCCGTSSSFQRKPLSACHGCGWGAAKAVAVTQANAIYHLVRQQFIHCSPQMFSTRANAASHGPASPGWYTFTALDSRTILRISEREEISPLERTWTS